ncbi:MAG: hypothetical protein CHACPFDD_00987 [Phycisphaerae bacterium]|nr:hypothetical protein [Phycisphaerae bacterium]
MAAVIRRETFVSAQAVSLRDVQQHADGIVAQAREEARRVLAEAEAASGALFEQRRAEGYTRGFAEGRAAGESSLGQEARQKALTEARAEISALLETLRGCLAEFDGQKRHALALAQTGIMHLAWQIARRVCKCLAESPGARSAAANAAAVLEMAQHEHDLRVHLHPFDHAAIIELGPALVKLEPRLKHVELVADAAVARGGCALHMRSGTIDAGIDVQLERVAAALLGDAAAKAGDGPGAAPASEGGGGAACGE